MYTHTCLYVTTIDFKKGYSLEKDKGMVHLRVCKEDSNDTITFSKIKEICSEIIRKGNCLNMLPHVLIEEYKTKKIKDAFYICI